MSENNYRVRAVLHHDDGAHHPDWGSLVAYDRRLSYHRTFELAKRRFEEIAARNGTTDRAKVGTRVVFVEIDVRYITPTGQPRQWTNLRRFRGMWKKDGELAGATIATEEVAP